ncbi:MAG: Rieske 2Fe-2S domain-containing protein [Actinomycetes bacterium]|jgi:nitrite reductase/ring-hydroxylating ferredoxin subunit
MREITRRGFMKLASALSLAGAGSVVAGAAAPAQAANQTVVVGLLSAHPVGKTKLYNRLPGFANGYGLIITRTGVNKWTCFYNMCTHETSPVTWMNGNTATCTRHGYSFSAITGACTNARSGSLAKYAVNASKGKIYVTM